MANKIRQRGDLPGVLCWKFHVENDGRTYRFYFSILSEQNNV